jgi:hypothetical protein
MSGLVTRDLLNPGLLVANCFQICCVKLLKDDYKTKAMYDQSEKNYLII